MRETTFTGAFRELVDAYGGVGQFAKACGVSTSTVFRWAHKQFEPAALVQRAVNSMAKRRGITKLPFPKQEKRDQAQ